MMNTSVNM